MFINLFLVGSYPKKYSFCNNLWDIPVFNYEYFSIWLVWKLPYLNTIGIGLFISKKSFISCFIPEYRVHSTDRTCQFSSSLVWLTEPTCNQCKICKINKLKSDPHPPPQKKITLHLPSSYQKSTILNQLFPLRIFIHIHLFKSNILIHNYTIHNHNKPVDVLSVPNEGKNSGFISKFCLAPHTDKRYKLNNYSRRKVWQKKFYF